MRAPIRVSEPKGASAPDIASDPIPLPARLVEDLIAYLDAEVCGGLPSPETSAQLLRRLREAVRGGR